MPETRADSGKRPDTGLTRQASVLRRNSKGTLRLRSEYGGFQKTIVLLFMLVSISGATVLLISESNRQLLISRLGIEWTRLYQSKESRGIFELPPPPPRRIEPQVIFRSVAPVAAPEGTVYTATPDESGGETIQKIFIPPQVTPGFEAAFRLLSSESVAASKLFKGELPNLRYKEWKPLQNKHPEYLIAMVAELITSQTELQYVWSVNTETSRIVPLSQDARDLERNR